MSYSNKVGVTTLNENSPISTPKKYNSLTTQQNSTPKNTMRSSFRRYSLADWPLSPQSKPKKIGSNAHISTKIDSNSPGYCTRVVQYSEEQERSLPTHHSKYDKLGVFPIVHFFKKDLPCLKRKAHEISTDMNSSELSRYNSPEQNRMLLNRIIKASPGSPAANSHKIEVNTKSVLDALKEISRKRIHSNGEEFIVKEDGKRMHADYDESSSRKRLKHSSQIDNFAIPTSKIRAIDELMASHSSMDGYFIEESKKQKQTGHTKVQVKSPPQQIKGVDVETQTTACQETTPIQAVVNVVNISKNETKTKETQENRIVKKRSPIKIFDETPLETMRRNRLSALVGSLGPNKPQSQESGLLKGEVKPILSKPLVSILSNTKSPNKSNKHVTFDIPEASDLTSEKNNTDKITSNSFGSSTTNHELPSVTKTSAAVNMPIVSASIVGSHLSPKTSEGIAKEIQPSFTDNKTFDSKQSSSKDLVKINFDIPKTSSNVIINRTSQFPENKSVTSPKIAFNLGSEEKNILNTVEKNTSSGVTPNAFENSQKTRTTTAFSDGNNTHQIAGFKFDLNNSDATEKIMQPPPFSFVKPTTVSSTGDPYMPVFSPPGDKTKGNSLGFGFSPKTPNQEVTTGFSSSTTKPFSMPSNDRVSQNKNSLPSIPQSSFGFASPQVSIPNLAQPAKTSSITNSVISNKPPPPNFSMSISPSSQSPVFNFDPNSNVKAVTDLQRPTLGFPDSASKLFNSTSATGSSAALTTASSTAFNLTVQTTSSSMSPFSNTRAGPAASNSSIAAPFPGNSVPKTSPTNTFFFGPSTVPPNKNASTLNDGNSVSNLKVGETKSVFGNSGMPSFGASTTGSTFSTTTTPAFGTTTSASTFGTAASASAFGTATATPAFGTATVATAFGIATAAPTFGTATPAPSFGTATPAPSFGTATAAPAFGTLTPAPAFGTATTAPAFGTTTTSTFGKATTAPAFGTATAPTFGNASTVSTFGATTTASTFGATATSTFGTAPTGPTFGNTSNSTVTSNTNIFGNVGNTTSNMFGNTGTSAAPTEPPPFGLNAKSSFGSSNFSQTGFGDNANNDMKNNFTSTFGSSYNAAFATTTNNTTGFSNTAPSFSTPAGSSFSSNPTFVQNNAHTSNFGTASPFDKPVQQNAEIAPFGNNTSATFGSNSFGNNPPPNSQNNIFTFGSNGSNNSSKPAIFSFGTGEPPKPSFNFQTDATSSAFGVNNKGFNTSMPPTFSSVPPAQFNLQPPGGNMFNIGTGGSPAPNRSRPQHKAKRRT